MLDKQGRKIFAMFCKGWGRKRHKIFFRKGKGIVKGWSIIVEKLRELGVKERSKKKATSFSRGTSMGLSGSVPSYVEAMKTQRSCDNVVWVDAGDPLSQGDRPGTLKNCLVGRWEVPPDLIPSTKEMESWAKALWRLKGGILVAFLNKELLIFYFDLVEEANCAQD